MNKKKKKLKKVGKISRQLFLGLLEEFVLSNQRIITLFSDGDSSRHGAAEFYS